MAAFGAGVDPTGQQAAARFTAGRGRFCARQVRVNCLATGAGALAIVRALPTGARVADLHTQTAEQQHVSHSEGAWGCAAVAAQTQLQLLTHHPSSTWMRVVLEHMHY